MQADTAVPDRVVDKDKAAPVVEAAADDAGVADGAPAIPVRPEQEVEAAAEPASPATIKTAFTLRPWTTAIAPR